MTRTFFLPLPPNIANSRGHWAKRKRQLDEWKVRAVPHLFAARRRGLWPKVPIARYRASAHVVTSRPQDADNATARTKPIWDLLVTWGWLHNDSPRECAGLTVTTAVGPLVGVTVTLEDLSHG